MSGTLWDQARRAVAHLAKHCFDLVGNRGITLHFFNDTVESFYDVRTSDQVERLFNAHLPSGTTDLTKCLNTLFEKHDNRRPSPSTFLVITDGEPDNKVTVKESIIRATLGIDSDEELSVSFIQIGKDPSARKFLKELDDDLKKQGAIYDIVDTLTQDEMMSLSFDELIEKSVTD